MVGITIIIIMLVPIFFQVIMLGMKVDKRHQEIMEKLQELSK